MSQIGKMTPTSVKKPSTTKPQPRPLRSDDRVTRTLQSGELVLDVFYLLLGTFEIRPECVTPLHAKRDVLRPLRYVWCEAKTGRQRMRSRAHPRLMYQVLISDLPDLIPIGRRQRRVRMLELLPLRMTVISRTGRY
jgi:hypothetical protein